MPLFEYTAYDKRQNTVKDQMTADDERDVRTRIRELGYFPIDVRILSGDRTRFTPKNMVGAVGSGMQRAVTDFRSFQEKRGEQKAANKTYQYTAQVMTTGESVQGEIQAPDVRVARQLIRERNLYPLEILEKKATLKDRGGLKTLSNEVWERLFPSKFQLKDLATFVRQLGAMLESGLPLIKAIELGRRNVKDKQLHQTLGEVRIKLEEGSNLSTALNYYADLFPPSFIELVTAGEASGTLEQNLARLADFLEKQIELRNKIKSAMTYPAIVMFLVLTIAVAMLLFVLPQFIPLFEEFKVSLPLLTQVMIWLSGYLTSIHFWWQMPLLSFAGFWFFRSTYRMPLGRQFYQRMLYAVPLIGALIYKVIITRIVYTISLTMKAGVSIRQTLDSLSRTVQDIRIQMKLDGIRQGIEKGGQLSELCENSGLFPDVVNHLVRVGEETGNTDDMLERAAKYLDQEVEQAVKQFLAAMEPLMTLVMGGVVILMVLSIYWPIFAFIMGGSSALQR